MERADLAPLELLALRADLAPLELLALRAAHAPGGAEFCCGGQPVQGSRVCLSRVHVMQLGLGIGQARRRDWTQGALMQLEETTTICDLRTTRGMYLEGSVWGIEHAGTRLQVRALISVGRGHIFPPGDTFCLPTTKCLTLRGVRYWPSNEVLPAIVPTLVVVCHSDSGPPCSLSLSLALSLSTAGSELGQHNKQHTA